MINYNNEEIEILKIISRLPEFSWMPQANPEKVRAEIHSKIGDILHQYYIENTQNSSGVWTSKFKNHGISENDGKTMIACARRLGLEDRKSTRLNSSHSQQSRMPSSA